MKKKARFSVRILLPAMLLILIMMGIFLFRAPVLIVSDHYFNDVYGKNRSFFARIRSSISLFRRVETVNLAEDIGPDGIAFAVSEVSKNPFCVIFPYRFFDGAKKYQDQYPAVKTIISAGKEVLSEPRTALGIVQTDTETDLYRAGLSAAIISQGKEGKILCYIENGGAVTEKYFFEQGLKDGGREGDALFIGLDEKFSDEIHISCIVLTGSSEDSFITKENVPIILFSWTDPEFFPSQVNLIFSDSPWETAVSAVKMLQKGENLMDLPSIIQINPQNDFSFTKTRQLKNAFLQDKGSIK